jgi:hypothetical protein
LPGIPASRINLIKIFQVLFKPVQFLPIGIVIDGEWLRSIQMGGQVESHRMSLNASSGYPSVAHIGAALATKR